ncbi:hypothetical protein M011DRAFT_517798 [Sporormia fimetaria CBS 119925]|uniref:CWH43-like N-terminal domain-containing protein n=1 Tax=Sporormia fimetaria CBS 119925 TaxID=1340428 RepID=A0A6A6VL55_9PLEO|nr:hypothetical protein M011DRAFT_517798 [Sporormia fimetaria CBS 119925]
MWYISYWFWPVFASIVWLAMLITMMVHWALNGYTYWPDSMQPNQTIAYISDVGAHELKPLFIAMSAVTVVAFDIAFVLERWLRHTGRLAPNTSVWQKIWSSASSIAAIVGGAGLILLAVFDTARHSRLHRIFLAVFIGGYIVSAIFICWEYQRLGVHYKHTSVLRYSFWIKLAFIVIELALAITFGILGNQDKYNEAAVVEWTIAFIYFFYVLSFFIDFMPAVRTKNHQSRATEMDVQVAENGNANPGRSFFRGGHNGPADGYTNGHSNGYTNGHTNGYANGHTNGYANGYTNGHGTNAHNKPAPGHF